MPDVAPFLPALAVLLLLLLLSDYEYTSQMMSFAYDRHLPTGTTWRDLFDMVRGVGWRDSRGRGSRGRGEGSESRGRGEGEAGRGGTAGGGARGGTAGGRREGKQGEEGEEGEGEQGEEGKEGRESRGRGNGVYAVMVAELVVAGGWVGGGGAMQWGYCAVTIQQGCAQPSIIYHVCLHSHTMPLRQAFRYISTTTPSAVPSVCPPSLQVIVMSRKPEFFSYNMPLYEVVTPDGLMRPVLAAKRGGLYCGGSARQVGWWCVWGVCGGVCF